LVQDEAASRAAFSVAFSIVSRVHLRLPAIDPGVSAFVWGVVVGLYVWLFLLGVGVDKATSLIIGLLTVGAVFLVVRLHGSANDE
jgi:hypothetical protein